MTPRQHVELIKAVWRLAAAGDYISLSGESVTVRRPGEYDEASDRFTGAEAVIGGVLCRGEIVVTADDETPAGNYESIILQLVPYGSAVILKSDGTPVAQVVVDAGPVCKAAYETLCTDAANVGCAGHISCMEQHERVAMFTRLLADRLGRKCADLHKIYLECDQNWNETMYVMLLRTMGDSKNKEAFTELARRVRYSMISRERNSIQCVEAMMLGTSGLLDMYGDDVYVRALKSDFEYLRRKYNIMPMVAGQWVISRTNPHNHPVLRIVQLAAFLSTQEFIFENMVRSRTVEDLHVLFRAEASQYWSTHFIPGRRSDDMPKRIGHFKRNLLGINLAVPMIFAYGDYVGDEVLKEHAVELLEKITCESNTIVDAWRQGGVPMESAFDSQAILQLNNEFCARRVCWKCPVGKRVIREARGSSVLREL